MSAWDNLLSHALSGGGGMAVSGIAAWWLSFRKDKREDKSAEIEAVKSAMAMLSGLTEELHDEVSRLRERQKASEEAEEACKRNLRAVRETVHAMANALQRAGVPMPQGAGWPPAGE